MSEIVLTSSVLIAIITILRYFLRGKIAPRLQYALWLLVAARLLIPGSLFTVPVSVTGAAGELSAVFEKSLPEQKFTHTLPDSGDPALPSVSPSAAGQTAPDAPSVSGPTRNDQNPWLALHWRDIIRNSGILVTGGAMLLSNLHFYACLRKKRRKPDLPPDAESGNLPVYLVEDLPSPCLFGLLSPAIYLNRQALDPAHLPYVLSHERTHFRHGDHLWSVLRGVCLAVYWYNPLVWLAAFLCRQDCELACDDGVIWLLGEKQRLEYGTALVRMITPSRPSLLRASTSMTAGKRNMKERIALIIQRPRMMKLTMALVALIMCGAVAVTFGASTEAAAEDFIEQADPFSESAQPRSITPLDSSHYTHFSGLFSLSVPEEWTDGLLYEENEDCVYFYDAASYREAPDESRLLTIYPQASAWAAAYDRESISLDEFNTNGSPYIYLLDWNQAAEDSKHVRALRDAVIGSFRLTASADVFSRLVHESYEHNMPLAVAYLPYLSWESYQTVYGEDDIYVLLTALTEFVRSSETDWNQYHDILSNRTDDAITGPLADAYRDFIWELYSQNPSQFGSVLKSEFLTSSERDQMLSWYRSALAVNQDWPEALNFDDDTLYYLLGITEVKSVG